MTEIKNKSIDYSKKILLNKLYFNYNFNNLNEQILIVSASFHNYIYPLFPKNVKVIGSELGINKKKIVQLDSNCYSEKKVELLKNIGIEKIDVLYTDSISDLPLAKISSSIIIVSGNNYTKCSSYYEFQKNI